MATATSIDPEFFEIPPCPFFVHGTYPKFILWYLLSSPTSVHVWEIDISDKDKSVILGLNISFSQKLTNLSFLCTNELNSGYILYFLSASGTAYRVNIKDFSSYGTSHSFTADELVEIDSNSFASCPSTYIAATTKFLALGKVDGSVSCFPIRIADEDAQGFQLLETPSSSQSADRVKSLALPVGDEFVVVLHSQGKLRVWDLNNRVMVYSQYLNHSLVSTRLWAGVLEADTIPSHILYNENRNAVSNTSIANPKKKFIILQDKSELRCGEQVMETAGLLEWINPWFCPIKTEKEYCISLGDFAKISIVKFVNWEFNGALNYPHQPQTDMICWVFTLCDQLEAMYNIKNPNAKPIRISKQYILDHIPRPGADMHKPFGCCLTTAYNWAAKNPLVLEEDYPYDFSGTRESQKVVTYGPRVIIGNIRTHTGDKQKSIEDAISQYPIGGSMYVRKEEVTKLVENPNRPYLLCDEVVKIGSDKSHQRHAVVLSGMVSCSDNEQLDSYFAKDPQYIVPSIGRFFLMKYSSLPEKKYNPLRRVVYPEKISLGFVP